MPEIFVTEISHQNVPLILREKVTLNKDRLVAALNYLKQELEEVFIISTCNRLAIYSYSDSNDPVIGFFNSTAGLDKYLTTYSGQKAVDHLLNTSAGLESQIVGEHQILGQIKDSYKIAKENHSLGPILDELIRKAIHTGKRVRHETTIGTQPVSLASVVFELINKKYDLSKSKVLVIGTGEMAQLQMKMLIKRNPKELLVVGRNQERTKEVAKLFNAKSISYKNLIIAARKADVIVGATWVDDFALSRSDFESHSFSKKLMIDFGLPRNFDSEIKLIDNISLFDLDGLKKITHEGIRRRKKEIPKALEIIKEEISDFTYWLNTRAISPTINSYMKHLEAIREEELGRIIPKLGPINSKQKELLQKLTYRIIRRIAKKPIQGIREYSQESSEKSLKIDTFKEIFGLK